VKLRQGLAAVAALGAMGAGAAAADAQEPSTSRGPSTATDPYVLPVAPGVSTTSLLTVDDAGSAANGYELVGIPDGQGVLAGGPGLRLAMNHELRPDQGIPRAHGQTGAFVSDLTIDPATSQVTRGADLIRPGVRFYDYTTRAYSAAPHPGGAAPNGKVIPTQLAQFSRFCSSSISAPGQLAGRRGIGYDGQIYFANEEAGNEGRAFGVTETGDATQLPRLGLFSWENTNLAPTRRDATVTVGTEDTADGQLWTYLGTKQATGSPVERAGLANGRNHVWDVVDQAVSTDAQFRATYGKGRAARVRLSEVDWEQSGADQNTEAAAEGLTLNRLEDGAFDPARPNDFYFTTTEGGDSTPRPEGGQSRDGGGLWKLSFDDVERPERGATLTLVLDGFEPPFLNKPDNITIDPKGRNLLIQEDPGNNPHLARVISYEMKGRGRLAVVAQFDPAIFSAPATATPVPSAANPGTQDEESSGIVDASKALGDGWFTFDAQVHRPNANPEYVEYGQLLALHVRDFGDVYRGAGG
jgi:hypothetical protein